MGLLKLLTFPISGPVSRTRWVLQTVLEEAERKYYDEAAIHHEIAELERQHRDGAIDDETFEAKEDEMLEASWRRGSIISVNRSKGGRRGRF
jgi:hypothetical protein